MPAAAVSLAPLAAADWPDWRRLYEAYAACFDMTMDDRIAGKTWSWLLDPAHPVEGVLARLDGAAVGLMHYRTVPNPLRGTEFGYGEDLYVDPAARGCGVAAALVDHIVAVARERGWPKVRWVTADNNYRARALYDRIAAKTSWNVYELVP
jgi:GNAT superfamily N-acetyltransferase